MIKVFAITFQSPSDTKKVALFTSIHNSLEEATAAGFRKIEKENTSRDWTPILANVVEVPQIEIDSIAPEPHKETKNWILNILTDKKDKVLFKAVRKYLNKNEQQYILSQFDKKNYVKQN